MTHYQKLATMFFRILGILVILVSIIYAIIAILGVIFAQLTSNIGFLIYANNFWIPWLIFGLILFVFSKILAKWTCRGLD